MTQPKSCLRRILIIAGILLLASFIFIVIMGLIESNREQIELESEMLNVPVEEFSLNFAALDEYVQSHYPEKCVGLAFVGAEANIDLQNGAVVGGTLMLEYYRYIDESMEGGNIEAEEFHFDPVSGTLIEALHEQGSGRSYTGGNKLLSGSALAIPLELYLQHAAGLTGTDPDEPLRFLANYYGSWMNVQFFSESSRGALYAEQLTGWDEADGFEKRVWEPLDWAN